MTSAQLKKIIKEAVQEVLNERRNYDYLTDGVHSSNTMIGEAWNKAIYSLATLIDEIESFNSNFGYTMSKMGVKEKLTTQSYVAQLEQVMQILGQLHAPVKIMSDIESKDAISEDHPHGRYAQQAGATPFEPPQDF